MSSPSDRSRDQAKRHWQRRGVDESSDSRTSSDYSDMNETEEGGQGDEYELKEVRIQQPNGTSHTRRKRPWEAKSKRSRMKRILSTKHGSKKRRLVGKHGGLKVVASHVPQKHGMYLSDLFTTMIDSKWRWICVVYSFMYCGSWLLFGFLWWLVTFIRGDNVCVDNVDSFASAFLFSLETQTTIGYGGRQITPKCPEAVILLNVQSLIGFIIGAFMLGLIFAIIASAESCGNYFIFSKRRGRSA